AIEDTGCGMPSDVAARAFEPFFTTKGDSGGTGLGLSMVYGFARQSGGTVTIESAPGRGTMVKKFLPLASSGMPAPEPGAAPVGVRSAPRTILIVEDDADVRASVRRQLESLGHRVLAAEASPEALLLIQGPGAPDLLLIDVVLARGMNGIDLAEAARRARPGLPVIFMSGYTAVPEAHQRIRNSGATLLSKPFSLSHLDRA